MKKAQWKTFEQWMILGCLLKQLKPVLMKIVWKDLDRFKGQISTKFGPISGPGFFLRIFTLYEMCYAQCIRCIKIQIFFGGGGEKI